MVKIVTRSKSSKERKCKLHLDLLIKTVIRRRLGPADAPEVPHSAQSTELTNSPLDQLGGSCGGHQDISDGEKHLCSDENVCGSLKFSFWVFLLVYQHCDALNYKYKD